MKFSFNKQIFTLFAVLSQLPTGAYAHPKVRRAEVNGIEGKWIVVTKNQNHDGSFTDETAQHLVETVPGAKVKKTLTSAINAFFAEMTEDEAHILAESDEVDYIEQDGFVTTNEATWGLDRVDQRDLPLDSSYTVSNNGSNVYAYIIDTGIQITHNEFKDTAGQSRATWGTNTADNEDKDCNGHGTHVAGTVGGLEYGVAKNVNLVAVKVLACSGSGTTSGVIAGINWVKDDAVGKTATANMSLGGGFSQALNTAVKALHDSGVPTVVAAGNDNADACLSSPASEPAVITVGSTTSTDARSWFSNHGTCLDIFAPGSLITAAWIGSDDATNTINGTSMASPHVCGGVALLLSAGTAAGDITSQLISRATDDKVTDAKSGSPNKLLYVGPIGPTAPPAPTPAPTPTPPPTPCTGQDLEVIVTTDNFPGETSWTITNTCTGEENVLSGGPYTSADTLYSVSKCVPSTASVYEFTISDSYGDGICCSYGNGSYEVKLDGVVKVSGGEFGDSETKTFGSSCSTQLPTKAPTSTLPPTKAPSKAPTSSPTKAPSKAPTSSPTNAPTTLPPVNGPTEPPAPTCDNASEKKLEVSLTTDEYPEETSWEVRQGCSDEIVMKGGSYTNANTLHEESKCLLPGSYTFTIKDSHGDGICCGFGQGKYSVKFGDETIVEENEPRFKSEQSWKVGGASPNTFELILKTDDLPRETSWQLFNRCTGATELSASTGDYRDKQTEYTVTQCIPDGAYTFTIYDSEGNGIGDNGSYTVKHGGEIKSNGASFTDSTSTNWGSSTCTPSSLPSSLSSSLPSSLPSVSSRPTSVPPTVSPSISHSPPKKSSPLSSIQQESSLISSATPLFHYTRGHLILKLGILLGSFVLV